MRKDQVTMHSDGYGAGSRPAVNVKVRGPWQGSPEWAKLVEQVAKDQGGGEDADLFATFVESWEGWGTEREWDLFGSAAESEIELLQMDLDGSSGYAEGGIFPDYAPKMSQEGRSGGWLVLDGLPEVETWDAVMLARWARFAKLARSYADDVPYQMLSILWGNDFEMYRDPARIASVPCGACVSCGCPAVSA